MWRGLVVDVVGLWYISSFCTCTGIRGMWDVGCAGGRLCAVSPTLTILQFLFLFWFVDGVVREGQKPWIGISIYFRPLTPFLLTITPYSSLINTTISQFSSTIPSLPPHRKNPKSDPNPTPTPNNAPPHPFPPPRPRPHQHKHHPSRSSSTPRQSRPLTPPNNPLQHRPHERQLLPNALQHLLSHDKQRVPGSSAARGRGICY